MEIEKKVIRDSNDVERLLIGHSNKLSSFENDVKLLLTKVETISGWIQLKFGIELFAKTEPESTRIREDTTTFIKKVSTTDPLAAEVRTKEKEPRKIPETVKSKSVNRNRLSKIDGPFIVVEKPKTVSENLPGSSISAQILGDPMEPIIPTKEENPQYEPQTVHLTDPPDDIRKRKPQAQCESCGKIFQTVSNLNEHKKIHEDIRPFPCEICGKSFRQKRKYHLHSLTHLGQAGKTLDCNFCDKSFIEKRDLQRHQRTHTGEKPYPCSVCPKAFNVKQHLDFHMRTHTGEKPYECSTCGKSFSQPNTLRLHKKTHEGKKYVQYRKRKETTTRLVDSAHSSRRKSESNKPRRVAQNSEVTNPASTATAASVSESMGTLKPSIVPSPESAFAEFLQFPQ